MMRFMKKILPTVLILLFSLFFLLPQINKKLIGHHDWNSVVYGSSARSLIGRAESGGVFYQQDYPPLLPFSLSLSFLSFGIHEWSVRAVPIFFTFLTAVMIYLLAKKLINKEIGLAAAILYLNTPLIRYFGKIAVHETITPFFAILVFYIYWLWFKKQKPRKYLLLLLAIFIAEQAGWPGYYPVPLITLHYFLFSKKKRFFPALNWWLVSFLSFALFLFVDYLISGRFVLQDLWEIFVRRAAFDKDDPFRFTSLQFVQRELLWIRVYLTRVLTFFAVLWLGKFLFSLRKKKLEAKRGLLLLLLIFGLIHLLLFRQLCWLHDYMIIYLFPFLAIVSAISLFWVLKKIKINYFFIVCFLLFLMYLESRSFLSALEKAEDFYGGWELGVFAQKISNPKEKFFIGCKEAAKFYGVFFSFYGDRNCGAGEPDLKTFLEKKDFYESEYRYFVVDKEHNRLEKELLEYFRQHYQFKETKQFQLFDLKSL